MDSPVTPHRSVTVRAPTRIDLGGGWTDVPPYCDEQGGFVCNVAINRYAVATLSADETYRAGADGAASGTSDALTAAAMKRSGIPGIQLHLTSDFPMGAGLGGSSAALAAVHGALDAWRGVKWSRPGIAEEGRRVEVDALGIAGGRQDHYAATHGGALGLTFTDSVRVRPIPLSATTVAEFERRGLLVYTGESRISDITIRAVLGAYRERDPVVCDALAAMKTLARDMVVVLESGDLDLLGALIAEHWLHQRSLHPAIATARIDEIVMRAHAAGARGWKAMGASGGGCVFVLAAADNVETVRAAVGPLGQFVPFQVDRDGLSLIA